MLDIAGAVPATGADLGVADHYGDPLREQRAGERGAVVVDRSHRGVLRITGVDRLSWLHSITSQHLAALPAMRGSEALVLSPHGHVEHHLMISDDGTATWLDVEPGTSAALLAYLESMRFLLRVEPVDVHADHAVLSVLGPTAVDVVTSAFAPLDPPLHRPARRDVTVGYDGDLLARGPYPLARALVRPAAASPAITDSPITDSPVANSPVAGAPATGGPVAGGGAGGQEDPDGYDILVRAMPDGLDLLVPRRALRGTVERLVAAGASLAGVGAFEAARVADRRPRLGAETDHRTIPHEVGWLTTAVHLDKGCYRGQETVARVHNLGRPPRRMVLLHLDGTTVARGAPVSGGGRTVGFVGTSVVHAELGPIALAIVKRTVPDDTALVVVDPETGDVAASVEPASGPDQPTRPAGRLVD
ncbi:glycine cleavage system protein T [Protofrankia sp. BMG5.30]|nr:glycine cleavage system protein T [Protofrankia sp. BMG5.30]